MTSKGANSIYIKQSRRKCSISNFKCFDIFDENGNKLIGPDCDVINLKYNGDYLFSLEIVDGKIHIWTNKKNVELEPIICTFNMEVKE